MTDRHALGLDDAELVQFLSNEVGAGSEIVVAVPGVDGYPDVALVTARYLDAGARPAMIEFTDSTPADGVATCAIVERGATYDEICATIIRGVVNDRRVVLNDIVTFAFGKLQQ